MSGKGFLIRGTLAPSMGSTTGAGRSSNISYPAPFRAIGKNPVNKGKIIQGPSAIQNNRIPSSISLKKNQGAR